MGGTSSERNQGQRLLQVYDVGIQLTVAVLAPVLFRQQMTTREGFPVLLPSARPSANLLRTRGRAAPCEACAVEPCCRGNR